MVNLNKDEKIELKKLNKALLDAQIVQELETARMTAFVLGVFSKYKMNRHEYALNPETGEFVKQDKPKI